MDRLGYTEAMNFTHDSDDNWAHISALLPKERDDLARQHHAFVRPREIKSSDTLLRLAFLYSWADLSLRETAAAANEAQLASVSDVALLKRFRKLAPWLEAMILQLLQQKVPAPVAVCLPYRIQIVDGSVLCLPGSQGTDYRLHAQYSLLTRSLKALTLTDASGGESFVNYSAQDGDLFIADRGYGHRAGIAHIVTLGGQVLVRFACNHLSFQTLQGTHFDLIGALSSLKEGDYGDWTLQTTPDTRAGLEAIRGRVVALPRTPEATQRARQLAIKAAAKKKRQVQPQTLLCCGYIFVFTTLPSEQVDARLVLALYRFRWQVELAFKRLKSQLHLDAVRAHAPDLVRTYLLCKLLGAVLLEDLTSCWVSFSPRGPRPELSLQPMAFVE